MKPLIIGNWKMQLGIEESKELATKLRDLVSDESEVVVCPSISALTVVAGILRDSPIALGAQNVFWEERGTFTGEESAATLKEIGCKYVLIGHSERREYLAETHTMMNRKIQQAIASGLFPVLCVGETFAEYKKNLGDQVIQRQLNFALEGISTFDRMVIAYEPVWAISQPEKGITNACDPMEANARMEVLRSTVRHHFKESLQNRIQLIYGGSTNVDNIRGYLLQESIDGVLAGGASLKADIFAQMTKTPVNE